MDMFSFSELYDVFVKATYPIQVGDRTIEPGETIAMFDSLQISNLQELKGTVAARGGFDNAPRVFWTSTNGFNLTFEAGVFSKEQLGLLWNSRLIKKENSSGIQVSLREEVQSGENYKFQLKEIPIVETIFIYKKDTGERVNSFSTEGKNITVEEQYIDYVVFYQYLYNNNISIFKIGAELLKGFLELEGKTRVKDSETGQVVTGIVKIPKLKLMSDFSIRLGRKASPVVGRFSASAVPVGDRGNSYICEFYLLSDDVSSDF